MGQIVSLEKKRSEKIRVKKREVERVLFNNFLGVFISVEHDGKWIPIKIVDISPRGCLLEIIDQVISNNLLQDKKELSLRFYFTPKHYLLIDVKIKHENQFQDVNGTFYHRFGVEFNQHSKSFIALASFIEFIYNFSEYAVTEK